MKRFIITSLLLAGFISAGAQASSSDDMSDNSSAKATAMVPAADLYGGTAVSVNKNTLTFSGLPAEKTSVKAVISNADGNVLKVKKVDAANNTMDVASLEPGMYFVTLVCKNKNKKGFVIHL